MTMKKAISATLLALALVCPIARAEKFHSNNIGVDDFRINPNGDKIELSMTLDVSNLKPARNYEYCITPIVKATDGTDSIELQPVIVAGRSLYILHQRENDLDGRQIYRASKKLTSIPYSQSFTNAPWFENATVKFDITERCCCDSHSYTQPYAGIQHVKYTPVFNYLTPIADAMKIREINKRAYINFPVNKTELYPNYMNNPKELAAILSTIDSVRNDPDITIKTLSIKGFASPEGNYYNNLRLAKGRTETLKDYVEQLYRFTPGFIKTSYEPEDWEGLKDFVEKSDIQNKTGLLEIIDSDLEPDAKDKKIRVDFPVQYKFLLETVYPSLRHSDYRIEYEIRTFNNVDEILAVMRTAPQKLSLNELYHAASNFPAGSPEANEIYEVVVRMFPESVVANVNAANNAMNSGDYSHAEAYLNRAGDDPTAIYARGVLAALQGNYTDAENYFAQAARLKVADAPEALQQIKKLIDADGNYIITNE